MMDETPSPPSTPSRPRARESSTTSSPSVRQRNDDPIPGPSGTSRASGRHPRVKGRKKRRTSTTEAATVPSGSRRHQSSWTYSHGESKRSRINNVVDEEDAAELRRKRKRGKSSTGSSAKGIRRTLREAVLDEDKEDLKRTVRDLETAKLKLEEKLEDKNMRLISVELKNREKNRQLVIARAEKKKLHNELLTLKRDQLMTKKEHSKQLQKVKRKAAQKTAAAAVSTAAAENKTTSVACAADTDCEASTSGAVGGAVGGGDGGLLQDMLSNFKEFVDSLLACAVCSEVYVFASTVVACGHTFCESCIERWNEKSNACPICRSDIKDIVPNVIVDSYIDRAVDTFFPDDAKATRKSLVEQRSAQRETRRAARPQGGRRRRRIRRRSPERLNRLVIMQGDVSSDEFSDATIRVSINRATRGFSSSSSSSSSSSDSSNSSESSDSEGAAAAVPQALLSVNLDLDSDDNDDDDDDDDDDDGLVFLPHRHRSLFPNTNSGLYEQMLQRIRLGIDTDPDWSDADDDDDDDLFA
jgi:hypothetical protein